MVTLIVPDWCKIFRRSRSFYNNLRPAVISEPTLKDITWLEKDMNSVHFDDVDPLKQCVDKLKFQTHLTIKALPRKNSDLNMNASRISMSLGEPINQEDYVAMFEELNEFVETTNQNSISICRMGGMKAILEIIIVH